MTSKPTKEDPYKHVGTPPSDPIWWLCVRQPRAGERSSASDAFAVVAHAADAVANALVSAIADPSTEPELFLPHDVERYVFFKSRTWHRARERAMIHLHCEPWELIVRPNARESVVPRTPRGLYDRITGGTMVEHTRVAPRKRRKRGEITVDTFGGTKTKIEKSDAKGFSTEEPISDAIDSIDGGTVKPE